jgi:molybdopterin/thiamine biosynthesis adenylyltransferase
LCSNFYCTEADVGVKSRAQASIEKLKELNPYVKVNVVETTELSNYSFVCITEVYNNMEEMIEIN